MSRAENSTTSTQEIPDGCIICLSSFGTQEARLPLKCINIKCGRHYCAACVQMIIYYNGNDQPYQCVYCFKKYDKNQLPQKNEELEKRLWHEACIKYGIRRTEQLLSTQCNAIDFRFDIDNRRRHLINLISIGKHYPKQASLQQLLADGQNIVNKLSDIITNIDKMNCQFVDIWKRSYRNVISISSDETNLGSVYIRLCEDLQLQISDAELRSIFPKTYYRLSEWERRQNSTDEFEPKVPFLFKTIEQDLMNQWSNSNLSVRTKIGVIGYTSAGKSTLINRLLDVQSLDEDGAAPVSMDKCTYFPLQYDRKEPFIDPSNSNRKTFVTFVDIHGLDENRGITSITLEAGNYLDEIRKADCDIYIFVYDKPLSDEQKEWISFIEEQLKRKCVLVRSKVDVYYLKKFKEFSRKLFGMCDAKQRMHFDPIIINQLRQDSAIELRSVYLVACDYSPDSTDAAMLLDEKSFDFPELVGELTRLVFDEGFVRIRALAHRTIARAINTTFRRGYILNVMKYKIAAGFASIIPFGDQLPRYLSRQSICEIYGIDDALRVYLSRFQLIVYDYKLQTHVFENCVQMAEIQNNSTVDARWVGSAVGAAVVVGGGFTDDILRVAAPAATAISGAARTAFTVATLGVGVVISAGIGAWSAVDSGKHIFSYINRLCDDIIIISNSLVQAIIEREQANNFNTKDYITDTQQNT